MKKPKIRILSHNENETYHWIPKLDYNNHLIWSDKHDFPKVEASPYWSISFGFRTILINYGFDFEWEWYLWVTKYNDNNFEEAKKSYPWFEGETMEQLKPWLTYNSIK